ncbi:MAG TPA: ATP-dependent 6-phosphofructokinase, partial [Longimicrobiales bacterium]|nr:ATP-dependent 6-phosphofructokinase [Longimicrobiales bacterium]
GDSPGLNAVIRALAHRCFQNGRELVGYRNGFAGVLVRDATLLDATAVKGILHLGGTMLGTSRTDPLEVPDGARRVRETLREDGVAGLVVIGGDGSLSASLELAQHDVPLVGVPKTIDNDLQGTDFTFGFDTAVFIATSAIDRLHSTAEAHNRVLVVEVMGRHTGWIAAHAGIAGGADVILVPELPFTVDQVCDRVRERQQRGRGFSIVVIAEGATPADHDDARPDRRSGVRPGTTSAWLAEEIEVRTGVETRLVVLGHIQRGGSPTAYDRMLATRFGVAAADAVFAGRWSQMVSLQGRRVTTIPLESAVHRLKRLDDDMLELIRIFG